MPKISIIVPVYNVEPYIHRCVDSILSQTFTDFELILIDDGSPDNCGEICDEYAKRYNKVYVIHQKNGGLSAARNTGIDWAFNNSNSEWITFIDSDDFVHGRYLEALYNAVTDYSLDLGICNYTTELNNLPDKDTVLPEPLIFESEAFHNSYIGVSTFSTLKLYRKSLFSALRYPVGKIHEDEFITYKTIFAARKIVFVDLPLYFYCTNNDGIMAQKWSEANLSVFEAWEEQIRFFTDNNYRRALTHIVHSYIILLATTITEKLDCLEPPKKKKYERLLRKKLRTALKKYRDIYKYNIKTWTFLVAYPIFEKLFSLFE